MLRRLLRRVYGARVAERDRWSSREGKRRSRTRHTCPACMNVPSSLTTRVHSGVVA